MHACTTLMRVAAIVGIATVAGAAHSLIVRVPVNFRAPQMTAPVQNNITDNEASATPAVHDVDPIVAQTPETNDVELDPLDIQGPEGTITLREAIALYDDGAYFIDARHEEEFEEGHIPGAYFLPAQRIRTKEGLDELATIPPDLTIVIYCVGGECDASHNAMVAIQKLQMGFTDIRIMGRGFVDWMDAGLPIEHPDGTITGELP